MVALNTQSLLTKPPLKPNQESLPLVCSVCTTLPTQARPQQGLFIFHRLKALSRLTKVVCFQPQAYFPLIKDRQYSLPIDDSSIEIQSAAMPYLPKFGVRTNGRILGRRVERWLKRNNNLNPTNVILDAHFGYPEGVGCYLVGKKYGMPVFITIRGLENNLYGTSIGDQVVEALNGCTGVVAVGESLRRAAIDAGVHESQITVIPNGIDHDVFRPMEDSIPTKRSESVLVSIGNLKHIKGQDTLIRAFHELVQQTPAKLVLIGGEDERKYAADLRDLVQKLKLESKVQFLGSLSQPEVNIWLNKADLFVLASRREGCCNAVLEALASGTPVVATEVGDNSAYVKSNLNGQLVPANDAAALATAIEKMLNQKIDRKKIADTVQRLSWDRTALAVTRFFEERLAAHSTRRSSC